MIKNILICLFILTITSSCKKTYVSLNGFKTDSLTSVKFTQSLYNFDKIMRGDTIWHTFIIKNTGISSLIITKIDVSCGCSYPDYPQRPILPGNTDSIRVRFSAQNKVGRQLTSLKFFMNTNPEENEIIMEGTIIEKRIN